MNIIKALAPIKWAFSSGGKASVCFFTVMCFSNMAHAQTTEAERHAIVASLIPVIQLLLADDSEFVKQPQAALISSVETLRIGVGFSQENLVSGGSGSGALEFVSSNPSVADFDQESGTFFAFSAGVANFTVTKAGDNQFLDSDSITFTVEAFERAEQTPLTATNNPFTLSIGSFDTNIISGGDGSGVLMHSVDDELIALIDEEGSVTAISLGTTQVVVIRQEDNDFLESDPLVYELIVEKRMQSPLNFQQDELTLGIGNNFINIANGGDGEGDIEYSSSNELIASVNSVTGEVTGISEGSVSITAIRVADAEYNASQSTTYQVTVVTATDNDCNWDAGSWDNCDWQ